MKPQFNKSNRLTLDFIALGAGNFNTMPDELHRKLREIIPSGKSWEFYAGMVTIGAIILSNLESNSYEYEKDVVSRIVGPLNSRIFNIINKMSLEDILKFINLAEESNKYNIGENKC